MPEFTHLHLHTQYSLLDGAIRLDQLFPKVLERGMKSVAMTDHGNLFGALDFYQRAKAHGVKPIFGCETYIAPDRLDKTERRSNHLILLAKNEVGWKNLSYLNSMGYLEGFYYNPRIDKALLRKHSDGLVGLSACLGGEVAQTIMRRGPEAAEGAAREFQDIFGKGNFFLELQPNGLEEQEQVNGHLIEMSKKTGIGVIATNDCHYLNQDDARSHEILMCVQQKKTIHDEKRMHHRNDAFFVKTPAEMDAYFQHIPEALENAAKLGALCNVEFKLGDTFLPKFQVPDGMTAESYLDTIARQGLRRRIDEAYKRGEKIDGDAYEARLVLELGVIQKMHFAGYFLIVWDFIRFAKEHGIPVGPGRGSGAGSLVAYATRITDIDPIANNLLFERFLNPERVSMPDFDIDFCMNRRDEVIDYVTDKYGKDNVGQIVTMHQIKARSGVRDVARAMAVPVADGDTRREAGARADPGQEPAHRRGDREGAAAEGAVRREPDVPHAARSRQAAGGAEPSRRQARGRRRHQRRPAVGVRAVLPPGGRRHGIVTQYDKDDGREGRAGEVRLPRPQDADRHPDLPGPRQPRTRGARRDPAGAGERLARRRRRLQDDLGGGRTGVFQLESSGFRELLKKLQPRLLRGHRRRRRALPPGAARRRHGRRLHQAQTRAQARRIRPPAARDDPEGHLRRHRLPGAGHADRVGAGGLPPGQGRSPAPRDGQEEGRGHGQGEGRLPRRREGKRASTPRSPNASST